MTAPRRRAPLVSPVAVRAWAREQGLDVGAADELPEHVVEAYRRRKDPTPSSPPLAPKKSSAAEERLKAETAAAWKAVREQAAGPKPKPATKSTPKAKPKPAPTTKSMAETKAAAAKKAVRSSEAAAAKKAEQERVAAERSAAREAAAAVKADRQRLAREAAAEAERLVAEGADAVPHADATVAPNNHTPVVAASSVPRILLVDDEESMRSWLRMQLERSGWQVDEAEDGPTALQRFDAEPAGVVVLDEYMPGMRGLEVARALRERDGDVTLLLFSASVDREVIELADRLSVHFVSKINLDLLLNHLEVLQGTVARAG